MEASHDVIFFSSLGGAELPLLTARPRQSLARLLLSFAPHEDDRHKPADGGPAVRAATRFRSRSLFSQATDPPRWSEGVCAHALPGGGV